MAGRRGARRPHVLQGDYLLLAAAAKLESLWQRSARSDVPAHEKGRRGARRQQAQLHSDLCGEYPPVNAFWSVTMYDGKTQLLIDNPINNRYLINSPPMLPGLKKNADGSLTLNIQKDAASADKKANWLPAPNGPIYLVMRLYWPKQPPAPILPPGEGTWQPPA